MLFGNTLAFLLTIASLLGGAVWVGVLRSWSCSKSRPLVDGVEVEGLSSYMDAGGTTPHFSQQATASSIHASSSISRDHSDQFKKKLLSCKSQIVCACVCTPM